LMAIRVLFGFFCARHHEPPEAAVRYRSSAVTRSDRSRVSDKHGLRQRLAPRGHDR
jgi:hypothetical protein